MRFKIWVKVDILDNHTRLLLEGQAARRAFISVNTSEMIEELPLKSALSNNPERAGFFVVQLDVTEIGALQIVQFANAWPPSAGICR